MTATPGPETWLDKPVHEIEALLLRIARTDAAPVEAREGAMRNVAAAALGASALSSTAALGARGSLLKGTSWLAAKWLAIGVGAGLLGIGVAQGIQELTARPAAPVAEPRAVAGARPTQPQALAVALESAIPAPQPEAAQQKPPSPSAPPLPSTTAGASASEPKSTSRVSSEPAVMAFPPANTKRSLTHELTLLEQTRSALQQDAVSLALQTLEQYRREFPHGSMQSQADALRVEALSRVSAARERKP